MQTLPLDQSVAMISDGASLMIRADGPHDLKAMTGQKIGVLGGTTTEEALRNSLKGAGITAEIIPAKTHAEGLAMLDDGKISAYFADRSILVSLIKDSKAPGKLMLAENYLSVEPYALALPRGDEAFRLAVDRARPVDDHRLALDPLHHHGIGRHLLRRRHLNDADRDGCHGSRGGKWPPARRRAEAARPRPNFPPRGGANRVVESRGRLLAARGAPGRVEFGVDVAHDLLIA